MHKLTSGNHVETEGGVSFIVKHSQCENLPCVRVNVEVRGIVKR